MFTSAGNDPANDEGTKIMFYTTTASGDTQFEQFGVARKIADGFTAEHHIEVKVLGHLDGDEASEPVLAYHTSPALVNGAVVGHFAPWTRIEQIPTSFVPAYVEGYTFAYKRTRIAATIMRPDTKGQPWLVVLGDGTKHFAANTKAMCSLTKRLGVEARAAKAGSQA